MNFIASAMALVALAVSAGAKEQASPYDSAVVVFDSATSKTYKSMRIPCIVNAGGLLIAAAEGRYSHGDQAENDIVVSLSKNGGKTWSAPTVAAKSDGGSTFNNPCLIYDPVTRRTTLLFQRYPKGVKERDGLPLDLQDSRALRTFVCFSQNGKTWTTPVEVTRETRHADCASHCSGPNPGVLLTRGEHAGRQVVVFNEAVKFGNWHVTAAYSDDHGKTWKLGSGRSADGAGINEVSSVESDEGGVLVVSRKFGGPGGPVKRVVRSADGGETWGEVSFHSELPCVGCQNGLTRYSFADEANLGSRSRILFSAPKGPGRNNGIIKMSYDGGATWPVEKSVGAGKFAYSAMCPLKPGYVGLLFEIDGGNTIKFTPISLKWLTDGQDSGLRDKSTEKK
ncbi:MAG: exo-alpha-sialidase [Akkermansiaceae bacterium]|nr:exo-alpha-sialidase [Akkermansiaceae bacterium]